MTIKKYHLTLFLLFAASNLCAKSVFDLVLVNINKIGYNQTQAIKTTAGVSFWVELGSELLLAVPDAQALKLPPHSQKRQVIKNIDTEQLYLDIKGICHNHLTDTDDKTDHDNNNSLFINRLYEIKLAPNTASKRNMLTRNECLMDLKPNHTLLSQAENMNLGTEKAEPDPNIVAIINEVDQTRWLDNVKFLSSHDRLYDEELAIVGNWLFNQFESLGLNTSKLSSPNNYYAGFNVIAVKQGTSRPDDWYFVGAHMDSLNIDYITTRPDAGYAAPGAEDNASGCSGVLELASVLANYETEATLIFACFAGHETNRLSVPGFDSWQSVNGSRQIVYDYRQAGDLDKIKGMFNMDMISYHNSVLGEYTGLASTAHETVSQELRNTFLSRAVQYTDISWQSLADFVASDHRNFSFFDIPAMMSSETSLRSYFGYHNHNDIWQNLDPYFASQIIKANLATLADLAGIVTTESAEPAIDSFHSGLWYNQAESGHGYTILVLPDNRINLQWYVYDNEGNQAWLIGTGSYEENSHQATVDMAITDNGFFPPNFDADEVSIALWGTLTIEFDGCHSGLATWQPTDDYKQYAAGSMPITRLASMQDLQACSEAQ